METILVGEATNVDKLCPLSYRKCKSQLIAYTLLS